MSFHTARGRARNCGHDTLVTLLFTASLGASAAAVSTAGALAHVTFSDPAGARDGLRGGLRKCDDDDGDGRPGEGQVLAAFGIEHYPRVGRARSGVVLVIRARRPMTTLSGFPFSRCPGPPRAR